MADCSKSEQARIGTEQNNYKHTGNRWPKQGGRMRQRTSNLLYEYWNDARNGRLAPCRYEIEPAKIPALLPEIFIAECDGPVEYRIRLAGTRICDQLGRELRESSLLEFWTNEDREAIENLLHIVVRDGAVASAQFAAQKGDGRSADFEMTLMPLVHTSNSVNRILGCITAIRPPFWLGNALLDNFELKTVDLIWPDGEPILTTPFQVVPNEQTANDEHNPAITAGVRPRFRVLQGGLMD